MEITSINPMKIEVDRPESAQAIANTKKVEKEEKESTIVSEKPSDISGPALNTAVDRANEIGQLLKRKLSFSIDEATDKIIVKVIDEESGEVVRQVPPNEMLRIAAHLKQLQEMNDRVMSAVESVILDMKY